jgi:hypothetical protein
MSAVAFPHPELVHITKLSPRKLRPLVEQERFRRQVAAYL